jgi:hypothetical protein
MSHIQMKVPQTSSGVRATGATPLQPAPDTAPRNPRQDFAFAVKLFGIAGLVVLAIWLMNSAVS